MQRLKDLFALWSGESCLQCLALNGGGSSRAYYRLIGEHRHCIGTIATNRQENEAFFTYTRHFYAKGIAVPELLLVDDDGIHYLQQDLGDTSLYSILYSKKQLGSGFDAEMLTLYRKALSDLDAIQRAGADMDFSKALPRQAFDSRSMLWDLNYFKYNFLKLAHVEFDEDALEDDFQRLVEFLLQADSSYFLYRDFQGRNIMVNPNPVHSASSNNSQSVLQPSLYYIDYQGGRRGAAQYDVASLLYSAKSDLPDAVRRDLLAYYVSLHGDADFLRYFWGFATLRILQTLGAYGYRGLFERKPYFLESIPLALRNLRLLVAEHPLPVRLTELKRIIDELGNSQPIATTAGEEGLTVQVMSFSYKQGLPDDSSGNGGGYVFDCRALPNPGRYPEYRNYTGRDLPVIRFLEKEQPVDTFLTHAYALVAQSIDKYLERHFTHLSVAFGCTGGQHRSVYCAEQVARLIGQHYPQVKVHLVHREQTL